MQPSPLVVATTFSAVRGSEGIDHSRSKHFLDLFEDAMTTSGAAEPQAIPNALRLGRQALIGQQSLQFQSLPFVHGMPRVALKLAVFGRALDSQHQPGIAYLLGAVEAHLELLAIGATDVRDVHAAGPAVIAGRTRLNWAAQGHSCSPWGPLKRVGQVRFGGSAGARSRKIRSPGGLAG